jgi:hypothetical protein
MLFSGAAEARLSAGVILESVPEMGNFAAPVPVALRSPVAGKTGQHAVRLQRPRPQVFSGPDGLHPLYRPRKLKDHRDLLIFTGIYSRWVTGHLNLQG